MVIFSDYPLYYLGFLIPSFITIFFKLIMDLSIKKKRGKSKIEPQVSKEMYSDLHKNISFSRTNTWLIYISAALALYFFYRCTSVYVQYGFFATYSSNLMFYATLSLLFISLFITSTFIKIFRDIHFWRSKNIDLEIGDEVSLLNMYSKTKGNLLIIVTGISTILSYLVIIIFCNII